MLLPIPLLPRPPPVPRPPVPPAGADPLFDRRLGSADIETEPMFLLMAGIVAAEAGAPSALAMRRLNLAERLAGRERERLQARAHGIGADAELVPTGQPASRCRAAATRTQRPRWCRRNGRCSATARPNGTTNSWRCCETRWRRWEATARTRCGPT